MSQIPHYLYETVSDYSELLYAKSMLEAHLSSFRAYSFDRIQF
jgi:hypothetical protein